jgi:glycine/D-amino acid oxidase-like deaminating enzyme
MWRAAESRFGEKLLHDIGALWMAPEGNDTFEQISEQNILASGLECERLSRTRLEEMFPWVNFSGVGWGLFEPSLGYLMARRACHAVLREFIADGGRYLERDGPTPGAGAVVHARGPWLEQGTPTRQEVFYFGTPGGWRFPAWVDNSSPRFYGIPFNEGRGFKAAKDVPGIEVDPTTQDRAPSPEALADARRYLSFRFPDLTNAPLLESRVCQYEMSPDGHLLIDRLPGTRDEWVVGGGSGHGFKIAPAIGEIAAKAVLGEEPPPPEFSLTRFNAVASVRWQRA